MPFSQSTVRIAKDAIASFNAVPNTNYRISFEVDKPLVRLAMVATAPNFPANSYYEVHVFNPGGGTAPPQEFRYTSGTNTTRLSFYLLLPIIRTQTGNTINLVFGQHDGENTGAGDDAAHVQLTYASAPGSGPVNPGYSGATIRLPAEVIEFVSDFYTSVSPTINSSLLNSAVVVDDGNPIIELGTSIHYLSGTDGQLILDVLENKPRSQDATIQLPAYGTRNNNMNIIALVKPKQQGNAADFVFELGDPERDARVKIERL